MAAREILPLEKIPISLWKDEVLHLPPDLKESYISELGDLDLMEVALKRNNKGDVGGKSTHDAHNHFATRFSQSSGRIEFTVLGPDDTISGISDAFLSSFSVGHVAVLDIPCGAGATSAALISTLLHLRETKVIPRLPLTITICAGDFSPESLSIYDSLLVQLVEPAAKQGITVVYETCNWDAYRGDHTAQLVDSWFKCADGATEHFVIVGNFSGALKGEKLHKFEPCLEHILSRLYDKASTLVWIEPQLRQKESLFKKLLNFFEDRISWFRNNNSENESPDLSARYKLKDPLKKDIFPSSVNVINFKRK